MQYNEMIERECSFMMRKKILFLPSAWGNELVFKPQIEVLSLKYDTEVIDTAQFNTISQTVKHIVNNYKDIYCVIGLSLGGLSV